MGPHCTCVDVQEQMEVRDKMEEDYRDWACMNHDIMVPETEKFTWVYDPDRGACASCLAEHCWMLTSAPSTCQHPLSLVAARPETRTAALGLLVPC